MVKEGSRRGNLALLRPIPLPMSSTALGLWIPRQGRSKCAVYDLCDKCPNFLDMCWEAQGLGLDQVSEGMSHFVEIPSTLAAGISGCRQVLEQEERKLMQRSIIPSFTAEVYLNYYLISNTRLELF